MKKIKRSTAMIVAITLMAAISSSFASASASVQTLTIWTFKQSEVAALQKVGAEWGAKNKMAVKVRVFTPDDAFTTKIQSAAKSRALPDILSVHSQGQDWVLAQAGILRDLTADFPASWQKQFLPGIMSGMNLTADHIKNSGTDPITTLKDLKAGHLYTIPMLAGTPGVVFARKSMLTKAGVNAAKPPTTWQAWVKAITATKKADATNGGLVTGLQVPETGYFWLYRPMAYAYFGKDAFYGRQGRSQSPAWDSAKSIESLKLYDQLTPLWAPGVLSLGIDQADQAFAAGKAAWDVGGTFTLSSLTTFGVNPKDISVFPVPAATGGQYKKIAYSASPLIGGGITTQSKHYKEALSFLKYLTSVKGAGSFAASALDLPSTKLPASAISNPLLKQLVGLMSTTTTSATTFSPNDFSADPGAGGTPANHGTAVELTKLVAKIDTPAGVGKSISDLFTSAWASIK